MTDNDGEEDPRKQFSDHDLTEAVREHEPAGTQEIAESIGATRRAVAYRPRSLAEADNSPVQAKKIGRSLVWYLGE